MNTHPYLRAYLAGVFVPTLVLPLILIGFITVRLMYQAPVPVEQMLIFPMAAVPLCGASGTCFGCGRPRAPTFPSACMGQCCPCC